MEEGGEFPGCFRVGVVSAEGFREAIEGTFCEDEGFGVLFLDRQTEDEVVAGEEDIVVIQPLSPLSDPLNGASKRNLLFDFFIISIPLLKILLLPMPDLLLD